MSRRITHSFNGDRILITAAFPVEAVTSGDDRTVEVTLDDQDWHDAAKGVLNEQRRAERALDPDFACWRVEDALKRAVSDSTRNETDWRIIRCRAVSNVMRRLADMALSGAVSGFSVNWDDPNIDVHYETGRGTRRRSRRIGFPLGDLHAGAETIAAPTSEPGLALVTTEPEEEPAA